MNPTDELLRIQALALNIRRHVVRMIGCQGQTGHLGGACSCADILAVLYGSVMRHDPGRPLWSGRDRLLLSKGHAAIAQYAALAEMGYFDSTELSTFKILGSRLQGHPDRLKTPGIEANTGSLGQGLSIAIGLALAMRLDKIDGTVYCIMGDGELAEGQIWEAAMAAAHYQVDNIVGIIDCNKFQATGACAERFNTDPLPEKWRGFGWHVLEVDGHDIRQLIDAFAKMSRVPGQPTLVIAHTVKGKGISFAEGVASFHNSSLTESQYAQAMSGLGE